MGLFLSCRSPHLFPSGSQVRVRSQVHSGHPPATHHGYTWSRLLLPLTTKQHMLCRVAVKGPRDALSDVAGGQGASERSHRWPAGLLRGSSADSSQQRRHLEPGASSGMRAVLKGPLYNWLQSSICGLFMELKNSIHIEGPQPVLEQTAGCPHRWTQQAHHGF